MIRDHKEPYLKASNIIIVIISIKDNYSPPELKPRFCYNLIRCFGAMRYRVTEVVLSCHMS